MKKILFLFLALLLPVLIFLFLKLFGNNKFEVPVLFADSVSAPAACTTYSYKAPYRITDSVLQGISWNRNDTVTIIVFEDENHANRNERRVHLTRIFTEFKTDPLHVVHLYKDVTITDAKADRLTTLGLSEENFLRIRNCVFLLSAENDAVIIDRQKRIRGQYNLLKREDADRMIMEEMNILFKRY
jgi:hypothetical protein